MASRLYPDETDPPPRPAGWSIEPSNRRYYDDERPGRGIAGFVRPVLYVLFAAGCAAALWFAYEKRGASPVDGSSVPLIHAEQGAAKIKPPQPGGEAVPDQDKLVYYPKQPGAKVERLLPPPEQPLARPQPPPPTANALPALPATANALPATANALPALPATANASTPLPVQEIGPTMAPKAAPATPDSAVLPPATASGTLTFPAGPSSAQAATVPPPAAVTPSIVNKTPVLPPLQMAAIQPHAASLAAPKPAPGPAEKPLAVPAEKPALAAGGGPFRVQIAATRDEAAAHTEWQRLRTAHGDLLGGLSANVVKADLAGKGVYYRVQAGPVKDHAQAERLCDELKKFAIACLIAHP
jgi:hypothetical protein